MGISQEVVADLIAAEHGRRSTDNQLWTTADVGPPELLMGISGPAVLRFADELSSRSVGSGALYCIGRRNTARKARPLHFHGGAPAPQPPSQPLRCRGRFRANCALPYDSDAPAVLSQGGDCPRIPFPILVQFFRPELRPAFRELKVRAPGVRVPEAPVHEDDGIPLRKHEVGLARELLAMQPVPESSPPKLLSEAQLGAGVFCPDT